MNSSRAPRLTKTLRTGITAESRRWRSYDKSQLRDEVLLASVERGLGKDADGKRMQIDVDNKTISTAAGQLPISPIFDPKWIKARRRQTKTDARPATGRFSRKLAANPYARALATPLRKCPLTGACMPRFFLQDFEVVKHPETGATAWAPGALAFDFLDSWDSTEPSEDIASAIGRNPGISGATGAIEGSTTVAAETIATQDEIDQASASNASAATKGLMTGSADVHAATNDIDRASNPIDSVKPTILSTGVGIASSLSDRAHDEENAVAGTTWKVRDKLVGIERTRYGSTRQWLEKGQSKSVRGYVLGRKSIFDIAQTMRGGGLLKARILTARTGMALTGDEKRANMRADMADFLLAFYRRKLTDALIGIANAGRNGVTRAPLRTCSTWDEVKSGPARGCVLWVPRDGKGPTNRSYATLDADGWQYDGKIAVHDLEWMLGETELLRLKEQAMVFRDNELIVLPNKSHPALQSVHMLLWRMQGYLAKPPLGT